MDPAPPSTLSAVLLLQRSELPGAGEDEAGHVRLEGDSWTVGETFQDTVAGRQIAFHVDAATADGFQVTIWYGVPTTTVFTDGFESGDTSRWSSSVP